MSKLAAGASLFVAITVGVGSHPPGRTGDPQYQFIDARTTYTWMSRTVNLSKVRQRLMETVAKGYRIHSIAGFSSSINVLLERAALETSYLLIDTSRESTFLKELNEAGAEGFRPLPDGIKALEEPQGSGTTWVAILAKNPDALPVKYALVKGTKEGEDALAKSAAAGRALVAILGRQGAIAANTLLFFEERDTSAPAAAVEEAYRIIATARTSALQNDLLEAAKEGFRVLGAGFGYMTVVMKREPASVPASIDYRVIAMTRVGTAVKELEAAAAEGFRIAAITENGQEAVFVLHRLPGTPERAEYRLIKLEERTANQALSDAQNEGFRIVRLLADLVLLERRSAGSSS